MHSTRGSAGASGANKKCCKQVSQKRDPLIFTTVATIAITGQGEVCFSVTGRQ